MQYAYVLHNLVVLNLLGCLLNFVLVLIEAAVLYVIIYSAVESSLKAYVE